MKSTFSLRVAHLALTFVLMIFMSLSAIDQEYESLFVKRSCIWIIVAYVITAWFMKRPNGIRALVYAGMYFPTMIVGTVCALLSGFLIASHHGTAWKIILPIAFSIAYFAFSMILLYGLKRPEDRPKSDIDDIVAAAI